MDNNSFEPELDDGEKKRPDASPSVHDSTSIDIQRGEKQVADKPYAGMGKEDLLRFSQTPFWNRLRLACLIIFWGCWVALLAAVVAMTVVAPRCDPPPEQTWWQRTVAYQVYVRSFFDTDGNGIGDINGVTAKLDYIQSLNAETVMLSAFYPSHYGDPDRVSNMGYDVIDHMAVDSDYGSLADVEALLAEAHARDMKVVIDFIPNHTGDKHPWFEASAADADSSSNAYWNYYVWADCAATPNWLSVYGGDAWADAPTGAGRTDCCLNQFHKLTGSDEARQPDLNLRSSAVRAELEAILRFWLELGVDGFRVVNANFLFEDADLNDEVVTCVGEDWVCRDHSRTIGQQETFEIMGTWRGVLEEYSADAERILISDANDGINTTVRFYGLGGNTGAHLPLNYQLFEIVPATTTGTEVQKLIQDYLGSLPAAATSDWLTGDQDEPRLASRVLADFSASMAMLKMTLPGPPLIYYGEELDMINGNVASPEDPTDMGRDNFRTLMQWDSSAGGGFQNGTTENGTTTAPWVPVNDDYLSKNVELLEETADSILHVYRSLADLRRTEDGLAFGLMEYAAVDDNIFSFVRQFDGTNRYLVAVNFGDESGTFDLTSGEADVPGSGELVLASTAEGINDSGVGDSVDLKKVTLGSGKAAMFMWPFKR